MQGAARVPAVGGAGPLIGVTRVQASLEVD